MLDQLEHVLTAMVEAVKLFLDKRAKDANRRANDAERFRAARSSVLEAYIRTLAYLADQRDAHQVSRDERKKIAALWQKAASQMDEYDPSLAMVIQSKAEGWADKEKWTAVEDLGDKAKLITIKAQLDFLKKELSFE